MGAVHCSRVLAEVRATIADLIGSVAASHDETSAKRLLDVGCWEGDATDEYAERMGGGMRYGIEIFPEPAATARARGIAVAAIDLEQDPWPHPSAHFDVVICNQVLEHLKNIWLPLHEMARVTRPGGHLLLSVPNLASAHNRLLLVAGRQPTSIRILGPHVRGFALRDFRLLVERGGHWVVRRVHGVGFPPLPVGLASPLARLWPGLSHTSVLLCERTTHDVGPLQRGDDAQTFYG